MDLIISHSDVVWHPIAICVCGCMSVSWEVVRAIVHPVAVIVVVGVGADPVAVHVVPLAVIGRERVVSVGVAVVVVVVVHDTGVVGRCVQAHSGAVPVAQHDLACHWLHVSARVACVAERCVSGPCLRGGGPVWESHVQLPL